MSTKPTLIHYIVCGRTKVTEISALLFCKVSKEPSVYLFYITVWHIAFECWVCVNNYGSHNRGEGFLLSSIISGHTELGVRMN